MKEQIPLEIERKYLIRMPDPALLRALGGEGDAIVQTYLLGEEGCTERVRMRTGAAGPVCTHTVKRRISALSREEREETVSPERYRSLLERADPALRTVEKRRWCIPWEGYTLEIDVFPFWRDRCLAELELPSETLQPPLPPWLQLIREVSDDPAYTNRAIAARVPWEAIELPRAPETGTLRSWAEVRLGAIRHNYRLLRSLLPEHCSCLGVVKADAYGHGAAEVARTLQEEGCPCLAVASLEEGLQLRHAGITLPILVLGPTPAAFAGRLRELDLIQTVSSLSQAREYSAALTGTLRCQLKLDTGMSRTGFDWRDPAALDAALALPRLLWEGAFTHFSCADEARDRFSEVQFRRFQALTEGRGFPLRHCVNSAALLRYPAFALDMARPGILLYGISPLAEDCGLPFRPAMTLKSRVAAVTEHRAGDPVSYGGSYVCPRDMRLAVLPIGYGDGLHRSLSGRLEVELCGRRVPQLGRICMDMCMVDVTDLPDCRVGDVATLFGETLPIKALAEQAGTIPYELTCAFTGRIPRVYME